MVPCHRPGLAIECKRLLTDRTVAEIGARLADYTKAAPRNGRRRSIGKHLDRLAFLALSPAGLSAITEIPIERLDLKSALVTDTLVPMQLSDKMSALVDAVCDLHTLEVAFGSF